MWETPRLYSLHCKRIITLSEITRFQIVIWDHEDNVLFKTTVWIKDKNITSISMEASIKALIRGLYEAMMLNITHISIYCNCYTMYSYLSGSLVPKEKENVLLIEYVKRISKRFRSINVVMMNGKNIELTYKLARETIISRITRPLCLDDILTITSDGFLKPKWFKGRMTEANKEGACDICFNDVLPGLVFSVDQCGHRFCLNCVKRHLEVKLLDGNIPDCPVHGCKIMLSIDRCGKVLNPKLSLMWKERIKEDSTPCYKREAQRSGLIILWEIAVIMLILAVIAVNHYFYTD